ARKFVVAGAIWDPCFFRPLRVKGLFCVRTDRAAFLFRRNPGVVLENNNGHLTQLSAERLLLFRALLPSRQEVLVSCPWAGPGEPGSAAVQAVRPSAW